MCMACIAQSAERMAIATQLNYWLLLWSRILTMNTVFTEVFSHGFQWK